MSEGSINSLEIRYNKRCHYGLNALNLTAWTDPNAGRRFYKCPRPKVTSCGYWEWQDKQQLPPRAVTVILELKGKLDVMKVERNKLKRIVDGMEAGERENLRKKVEEMDFVNLQEAAKTSILEEKIEEMEIILAQETGKAMILEKKITKLKTIIFVSCFLFIGFVVGIMK